MTDIEFYILEDTEEKVNKAFDMFMAYVYEGNEEWLEYSHNTDMIFCDEDGYYDYTVGKFEDGNYVLTTDKDAKDDSPKAYEFKLVKSFVDRF